MNGLAFRAIGQAAFYGHGLIPQDSPRVADVTNVSAIVRAAVEIETHSRRCATQGIIDRRVLVQLLTCSMGLRNTLQQWIFRNDLGRLVLD